MHLQVLDLERLTYPGLKATMVSVHLENKQTRLKRLNDSDLTKS